MAQAQVVKPRTERIQPGIWRLKLPCPWPGVPHGNAWAVQRGAGLVLFDTGLGGRGRLRMLDIALAQTGFGVDDVKLVVCTHAHSDHYGLAASICERTGCELWMHPKWEHIRLQADDPEAALEQRLEVGRMSGVPIRGAGALPPGAQPRRPRSKSTASAPPDRELVPGVEVETDVGAWEVYETPGHAPSHVCLHQPERRLLVSGDHLLGRSILFFDYGHTPDPVGEYLHSLDTIEPLDGRPLPARPRQTVPRTGGRRSTRSAARPSDCSGGSAACSTSSASRPPSSWSKRSSAARTCAPAPAAPMLQIVLACLDHLAVRGEARQVPDSDPQRWRSA